MMRINVQLMTWTQKFFQKHQTDPITWLLAEYIKWNLIGLLRGSILLLKSWITICVLQSFKLGAEIEFARLKQKQSVIFTEIFAPPQDEIYVFFRMQSEADKDPQSCYRPDRQTSVLTLAALL